jgi:hypothetical protein
MRLQHEELGAGGFQPLGLEPTRDGEHDGRERVAWDGCTVTTRQSGRAASGWNGRCVGEGQRRAGGMVDAPAAVACVRQWGKKMSLCFLFFWRNRIVLKVIYEHVA